MTQVSFTLFMKEVIKELRQQERYCTLVCYVKQRNSSLFR